MKSKVLMTIIVLASVATLAFVSFRNEAMAPGLTSPTPELNVTVELPLSGGQVTNPIIVKGKARVFENTFAYVLRDREGNKIYENFGMTDSPDAGIFGNYTVKIPVPASAPTQLVVEVFEYSAKDGSVINLVRVPVEMTSWNRATLKVSFTNSKLDPAVTCTKTFPVERQVYLTQEPGFVSLAELLAGPTEEEKKAGYITSINSGVRINSTKIENGTFYVDLNETLEAGVAGSCMVTTIRAQITDTLKQFPTVKNVVISINGRTEDILQP